MRLVLAPLADYTDAPFRLLCGEFGAEMAYTEMISAAALMHDHAKTFLMLEKADSEVPLGCQIFGAHEEEIAYAAREVEKVKERFVELNLNAGCPMPRLIRADSGACLAADPERTYSLLSAMKAETSLPVTLKTRPGPSPDRVTLFELLDAAERAGASAFILHGRFTSQMHTGPVCFDLMAETVSRAHIPVIGNGGVCDEATARLIAQTGVAAVMVARSAFHKPWVFSEIRSGQNLDSPEMYFKTARRHLELVLRFRDELAARHPDAHIPDADACAALVARTKIFRYFKAMPNVAALRARISAVTTVEDLRAILDG